MGEGQHEPGLRRHLHPGADQGYRLASEVQTVVRHSQRGKGLPPEGSWPNLHAPTPTAVNSLVSTTNYKRWLFPGSDPAGANGTGGQATLAARHGRASDADVQPPVASTAPGSATSSSTSSLTPVFKTRERRAASLAGSIPVRLRHQH